VRQLRGPLPYPLSTHSLLGRADQVIQMRRREFLGMLSGAAVSNLCPLAARAQQAPLQVVGSLNSVSLAMWANYLAGFRKGLSQMSYREGQNVTIEYRWAEGRYDRLQAMADELVGRKVSVIFASGGPAAARAAKAATSTIPIIFTTGTDPVADGLVASMNRPGGNATGVSHLSVSLAPKRFDLLSELVPKARTFTMIANSNNAADQADSKETQAAAIARGHVMRLVWVDTEQDIDAAFGEISRQRPDALIVSPDPFFNSQRDRMVAGAARLSLPTMYCWREYVDANGLISYAASLFDQYRLAGIYVGRILKGEKPVDLPVMQPTKFELVLNLKTARALGLDVPPMLLARADEVIE
jgi:putative ABC transport system substrate-binding protein